MANQPLVLTDSDVRDPNLLLRYLRKASAQISDLTDRLSRVESVPPPPSIGQVRDSIQATGSNPINVTGLLGVLAQPQPASATVYTVSPSGQVLQSLRDQQLVAVGNTSTGYALNLVIGGNPTSLYQLISNLTTATISSTSTNLMTLDTVQTSTGAKTLQGTWDFTGGFRAQGSAGFAAGAGIEINYVSSNGNVFSIDRTAGLFKALTVIGNTIVFQTSSGTGMSLSTSAAVTITNKISSYNKDALVGNGAATIVGHTSGLGITSTSLTVNLFTPPATAGGYLLNWYVYTETTGAGTVAFGYNYHNGKFGVGFGGLATPLTLNNSQSGNIYIVAGTSTTISVNFVTTATGGSYSYIADLVRLS